MAYTLQLMRALMETHPERAAQLRPHVEALETTILTEPQLCLHRVRTLFEAVHATIAPKLGVEFGEVIKFQSRNKIIIDALDFSVPNHPERSRINAAIAKLLGSINGTAAALAELSNIPNLRHGGSLDWGTLERQHALMLGSLCDTLVSFLFETAWRRPAVSDAAEIGAVTFESFAPFNYLLDEEYGDFTVSGATFPASKVLFELDRTTYDATYFEYLSGPTDEPDEEAAA